MKSVVRTSLLLVFTLGLLSDSSVKPGTAPSRSSRLTLWAWEMPEHLDFIDPREVAVAYLDQTVYVGDEVRTRPRVQAMRVPAGTKVIAVVRVEMPPTTAVAPEIETGLVATLLRSARRPGIAALQVDFDAIKSQQPFYGEVLRDLRKQMPSGMPLSITALASWCAYDRWLTGLPVDEAVPMFFRMGREQNLFRSPDKGSVIHEPLCSSSLGLSTDEAWPKDIGGKHLYIFNPRPWTPQSIAGLLEQIKR
jgi:hypothetical protein